MSLHFISPLPRLLPRSQLFPYTTLFRSRRLFAALSREVPEWLVEAEDAWAGLRAPASRTVLVPVWRRPWIVLGGQRSEEHTSELQSQFHLVCRLLLENKKYLGCCCIEHC